MKPSSSTNECLLREIGCESVEFWVVLVEIFIERRGESGRDVAEEWTEGELGKVEPGFLAYVEN